MNLLNLLGFSKDPKWYAKQESKMPIKNVIIACGAICYAYKIPNFRFKPID